MYVCMYVCMYVYFNEWKSNRVMVRLGLDTLIGCVYVCVREWGLMVPSRNICCIVAGGSLLLGRRGRRSLRPWGSEWAARLQWL